MSTPVGQPVPIQLVAGDGATYLFAEAEIYFGSTLVTTLDLPHQSSGLYSADFTPTIPGHYSVVARFFADPGHAVPAGYASPGGEFDVVPAGPTPGFVPGTVLATASSPVTPEEPLEPEVLPEGLMGVYPADVILRTAIKSGISDLRANPDQLDDVFHWLRVDEMSKDSNGDTEADRARQWFLSVDCPVRAEHVMTAPSAVMVSVVQAEENEAEITLADLHYDNSAPVDDAEQDLAKFAAVAYYPSTGVLVIPVEVADAWPLQAGMLVVDATGDTHVVNEVIDDSTVKIDPEVADFSKAALRLPVSRRTRLVESQVTRESFRVTCHVHGDPGQMMWLHAVVKYILTRYRAEYLELRGFERSTVLSGPFTKDDRWGIENMWSRAMSVTGYVRDVWGRRPQGRVLAVAGDLEAAPIVGAPETFEPDVSVPDSGYTAGIDT